MDNEGYEYRIGKIGAEYLHRTRIVSSVQETTVFTMLNSLELDNKMGFEYDKVIDTTQDTWIPWAKPHNISEVSNTYHVEREEAVGYVITIKHR